MVTLTTKAPLLPLAGRRAPWERYLRTTVGGRTNSAKVTCRLLRSLVVGNCDVSRSGGEVQGGSSEQTCQPCSASRQRRKQSQGLPSRVNWMLGGLQGSKFMSGIRDGC